MPNSNAHTATSPDPKDPQELARALRAQLATVTGGLAPDVYVNAWWDWYLNLANEPPKQLQIMQDAVAKAIDNWTFALRASSGDPVAPAPGDARFGGDAWAQWPFNIYAHSYRNYVDWWQKAWADVPGVAPENERTLDFMARNALETVSPANYLATNPELLDTTRVEAGENLVRGFSHWLEDIQRTFEGKGPTGTEKFVVGRDIAATPGKVVMRNDLVELIQYSPATDTVYAEPILIIPAWIMKYYILDLTPHNSMIAYLVAQGYTVFCISWRNVGAEDRDLSLEDYRQQGVMAALDVVGRIVPRQKIHAAGYCLGGTLLSIAAAAMAGTGDDRLGSITLLAAQTDFTEPGELQLFIDDSEVYFLESMMWSQGYLGADQMSGAFQLLQSNDLIWSRLVHDYLLGERTPMNDLMAWNSDSTRMPYRMHAEYLRQLFLNNDLASGRYKVAGRPLSLRNITAPMFVVGTERDHIAPWQSVYKIHALTDTEIMFVLTSGGHNAGIVSEPGHAHRQFRIRHAAAEDLRIGAEEWSAAQTPEAGSWWLQWTAWLAARSNKKRVAPPHLGLPEVDPATLADAPGSYIFQH